MKKIYIKPFVEFEDIELSTPITGSNDPIPPKGEDYTGGGENGPGQGSDDAGVGAKGFGDFVFDFDF